MMRRAPAAVRTSEVPAVRMKRIRSPRVRIGSPPDGCCGQGGVLASFDQGNAIESTTATWSADKKPTGREGDPVG
jgi:hypothetical protein